MKAILFLFITFSISAQIKGVVKDSITGKPIQYVGIWTNEIGVSTSSDEKGRFKIDKNKTTQFIEFFTTSYERKRVFVKDFNKQILLIPKRNIQTDSIILTNDFQKRVFDFDKTKGKIIRMLSCNRTVLLAKYIPYQEDYKSIPFLKSISFDLRSSQKAIYKIRFFKPDSLGNPSEEIGKQEIVCTTEKSILETSNPTITKFTDESKSIDLSKYKIPFPNSGLFVAIEIMDLEENKTFLRDRNNNSLETLAPSLKVEKNYTPNIWRFENLKWSRMSDLGELGINLILTN